MVVAENRLSSDIIRDGLLQHAADWPTSMLHYQDARGIPELRATLSHMVQRTFMKVGMAVARLQLACTAVMP
jgi:1-aminocyclopropane-1-carboxylate synthase